MSKYTRLSLCLLLVILVALQYRLWFSDDGWRKVKVMQQELAIQQQENNQLREHNRVLEAEVTELKQGLEGVEERARSELGMIKPGEKFYFIADDKIQPSPVPK